MALTITPLPPFPQRSDPANFSSKADAHVAALPTWTTETNALAVEAESNAADTETNKNLSQTAVTDCQTEVTNAQTEVTNAQAEVAIAAGHASDASDSADIAASNANFKGNWSAQTGIANVPYSVLHNDTYWNLLNNLIDVTTSEPGVTGDWAASLRGVGEYEEFLVSGTFNKDPNAKFIYVEVIAAGGSGCTHATYPRGGTGGGYAAALFDASDLSSSETVTVGAGGALAGTGDGVDGGDSSVGSVISASGGFGGLGAGAAGNFMNVTGSTTALLSDTEYAPAQDAPYNPYNAVGHRATAGAVASGTTYGGGIGGNGISSYNTAGTSVISGNGGDGNDAGAANDGVAPGGGGGSSKVNTAGFAGDGADGRVRIWQW